MADSYDAEPSPEITAPHAVRAGAGASATARIVVTNRAPEPRIIAVTALGVDSAWLPRPSRSRVVFPGESLAVDILLRPAVGTVPARYPLAIAVQALDPVSERATAPTALAEIELLVDAPGQVGLTLSPSDVTAVFGRKIRVVLQNTGGTPALVDLEIRAPESTRVRLDARQVEVAAGGTVPVTGRVSARKVRLFGQRARHTYTVTSRSGGAPRHVEGSFTARAMLGPGGTKAAAILAVVAVWVALAIVFIPKLADSARNGQTSVAGAGTTQPGRGSTSGSGAGSGGGSGGSGGSGGGADAGNGAGVAAAANTVQLNGVVASDAPGGVKVSMAPTSLVDEGAAGATPVGLSANAFGQPGMIAGESLPARPLVPASDRSTTTALDGAWSFSGVKRPGYYLVTFAKAGYQTQKFIVDSSAAVATQPLNVTLVPGNGSLSGRVSGPGGALGGAEITITDGTNTITTSSNSKGDVGAWTVGGLSTPSDYLVSAGKAGLGAESALVHLDAGGSATVSLTLRAGVTSIVGTVTSASGGGLGGIAVTATDGTTTRTASTVTVAGLRGRYTLSDLPSPGTYTVTFAGAGYLEQTVSVKVAKGQTTAKVDVALYPSAASVTGAVTGDLLDQSGNTTGTGPLIGAGLVLTSPDQTYKTTSAADGQYRFDGVAPGSYVLTAQYAGLVTVDKSVTVPVGTTQSVVVPTFHLGRLPDTVNKATIVGFVGDGSNPSNTLCPQTPGTCMIGFTLVASDGTSETVSPASQPTAPTGPTGYTLSSTGNLQPGLYRLTIRATDTSGNLSYLPVTVSVQVPLDGVAHAPQVNLYPANTVTGTVQVTGDLINDGPNPPYTNCVYAIPSGQPAPDTSVCDPSQLATSSCSVTGAPGPGYAAFGADDTYTIGGLCNGYYTIYYAITNPWFVNNVSTSTVTLSLGITVALPIQVATYGKIALTLARVDPANNTKVAVAANTKVAVTCTSVSGQRIDEPAITADGTLSKTYTYGGFAAGVWTCTATAAGLNPATTGQFRIGNGDLLQPQLVFTEPAGTFVGQVNTSWSGSPVGVPGGQVAITGTTGYVNGAAQSSTVRVTPDAKGCFAFSADGTLAAGFVAPGACATDPNLASATVALPLVYANASFSVTPATGYQAPPVITARPLDTAQLVAIAVQPIPVTLSGGSVQTDPAPAVGTTNPYSGVTIAVTARPPGAGSVTLAIDASTGAVSWQDSGLPAGQIAPGTYTIVVSKTGYVTKPTDVTCQPGQGCDLGTITIQQLGSLAVAVTSDGTSAVADPVLTLLSGTGAQLQTQRPAAGGNAVTFTGLTPGTAYAVQVQAAGYQFGDTRGVAPLVTLSCDAAATSITIAPGAQTSCTATLTRDGAITGTVTGVLALAPATTPSQVLASVRVTATRCGTQTASCTGPGGVSFSATADDQGQFRVTGTSATQGLDPGYWLLTVVAPGYSPPSGQSGFVVQVTSAAADTAFDPQLYVNPVRFAVTVKDQSGKAVSGLGDSAVTLISGGTVVGTAHEVAGTGNNPSTYVFDNAIPGPYTLEVAADGYLTADQQVTLALGQPNQSFTINVVAGANLVSGTVSGVQNSDTTASPLAGATVCLIKSTVSNGTCGANAATGTDGAKLRVTATPASGAFSFNTVPDGTFSLRVERYGYLASDGADVTYKHTKASPPAVAVTLTRIMRAVTVTVTASDPGDDLSGSPPLMAQLVSAAQSGSIPGNATLVANSVAVGTTGGLPDKHILKITFNQVAYGCWTFTFQAPSGHFGTLSSPTPSGGDSDLACTSGQFELPGTSGSGVAVGYTFTEFQPSVRVNATALSTDTAPTQVSLVIGPSASPFYSNNTFAVGTTTALPVWLGAATTATADANLPGWAAKSSAVSSGSTVTITLTEVGATVQIHVTQAGAGLPAGTTASVVLTPTRAGITWVPSAHAVTTGAGGIAQFSNVPFGTGWTATATIGSGGGASTATSTPFDITTQTPATIDLDVP